MERGSVKRMSLEQMGFVFRTYQGDGDAIAQLEPGALDHIEPPLPGQPFGRWLEQQKVTIQVFG